ncbi:MAG: AAA family ATPase, partial [Mesorhizobium sp.]
MSQATTVAEIAREYRHQRNRPMIIELFGPPGSGKTTFAHALARRLRGEGYHAKVVLSYQPSTRGG